MNARDRKTLKRRPDVAKKTVFITQSVTTVTPPDYVPEPTKNEVKLQFLLNLYDTINKEYDKIIEVMRRKAAKNPKTVMSLDDQPEEVREAARKIFGENVRAIDFERYHNMLKLQRDLCLICAEEQASEKNFGS